MFVVLRSRTLIPGQIDTGHVFVTKPDGTQTSSIATVHATVYGEPRVAVVLNTRVTPSLSRRVDDDSKRRELLGSNETGRCEL